MIEGIMKKISGSWQSHSRRLASQTCCAQDSLAIHLRVIESILSSSRFITWTWTSQKLLVKTHNLKRENIWLRLWMMHTRLISTRTSLAIVVSALAIWSTRFYVRWNVSIKGRIAVDRLVHIIVTCPSIAPQALQLAVKQIEKLRDPGLYTTAITIYEQVVTSVTDISLPPAAEVAQLDQKWIDETSKKNQSERTKLEVELKTYTNNMIKESQRVSSSFLKPKYCD